MTDRRTRLLIFESYYHAPYGNSRYLQLLFKYLDESRFSPMLVTAGPGHLAEQIQSQGRNVTVLAARGVLSRFGKEVLRPTKGPAVARDIADYTGRLIRLLREVQPQVMFVTNLRSLLMAGPAARFLGIPVCWLVSTSYRHPLEAVGYVLANRVVLLSERLRTQYSRHRPWRSKTTVNAIGIERLTEPSAGIRSSLGLSADTLLVGMAAMLVPAKGAHDFVGAARQLAPQFPNAHFIVIGDAPVGRPDYARELRHDANVEGPSRTHFLGWRSDAAGIIAELDVYCLPSYSEGVPRSLLEAMRGGVAVIANDVGGVADLVTPETGILIQAGAPTALSGAIALLLSDANKRRQLGSAGRELSQRYPIEDHVHRLEDLLSSLANRRSRVPSADFRM